LSRSFFIIVLGLSCWALASRAPAQTAPAQNPPTPTSPKPAQQPPKPAEANPFPEDTNNVPVMPSSDRPAIPEDSGSGSGNAAPNASNIPHLPLPPDDVDPARSPDDPAADADSGASSSSSDSRSGFDKVLAGADDDSQPSGKGRRKLAVPAPEHQETAAEDIQVGKYYLDTKNWKAALSRFESAMVLSPDEPEVYWGLAESARHLGNFAEARGYYQKVAEYDPDSKHGKEAIKALKDPEIANAKAVSPAPPAN
jgi:hypothetical protein